MLFECMTKFIGQSMLMIQVFLNRRCMGMTLQILADELTLSQPGGVDYAHHITICPYPLWIFRPSYGPATGGGKTYVSLQKGILLDN